MPSTQVKFKGHTGGMLSARLEMPAGEVLATAIFAHCFTGSKDLPVTKRIAQKLAASGIAVLRFDFTGLGASDGDFADTDFTTNVADVECAAAYLRAELEAPSLLVGHSLGGAAVLKAASLINGVKAVATIGAPAEPEHVLHIFESYLAEISNKGEAEVNLAGRPFTIRKQFLDDVAATDLTVSIAALKCALLVLHSPIDTTVGIENAAEIFGAARHPKSFVTLDQADHLVTRAQDADYAAGVIAAWATRYLDLTEPEPKASAPEGYVRSTEVTPEGFLQDIQSGAMHQIQADEPLAYGGSNMGMTPYKLLSAGLASCTSMTLRMYADHKGWSLDQISVDVQHDKVHVHEMKAIAKAHQPLVKFTRVINLDGDLDQAQRARLLEVADMSPIYKTLASDLSITTDLG